MYDLKRSPEREYNRSKIKHWRRNGADIFHTFELKRDDGTKFKSDLKIQRDHGKGLIEYYFDDGYSILVESNKAPIVDRESADDLLAEQIDRVKVGAEFHLPSTEADKSAKVTIRRVSRFDDAVWIVCDKTDGTQYTSILELAKFDNSDRPDERPRFVSKTQSEKDLKTETRFHLQDIRSALQLAYEQRSVRRLCEAQNSMTLLLSDLRDAGYLASDLYTFCFRCKQAMNQIADDFLS